MNSNTTSEVRTTICNYSLHERDRPSEDYVRVSHPTTTQILFKSRQRIVLETRLLRETGFLKSQESITQHIPSGKWREEWEVRMN